MALATQPGRRTRNMQDKRDRIFAAAEARFAEDGFEATTIQQIAAAADVATGTVFRYASSKSELLLMVYNERFGAAISEGVDAAGRLDSPTDAVLAMVSHVIDAVAGDTQPRNTVDYQRELLFGNPENRYNAEGLVLVNTLRQAIASRLEMAIGANTEQVRTSADRAARSVFAALHLRLAYPATSADWRINARAELHEQISQIITGFLATAPLPRKIATSRRRART